MSLFPQTGSTSAATSSGNPVIPGRQKRTVAKKGEEFLASLDLGGSEGSDMDSDTSLSSGEETDEYMEEEEGETEERNTPEIKVEKMESDNENEKVITIALNGTVLNEGGKNIHMMKNLEDYVKRDRSDKMRNQVITCLNCGETLKNRTELQLHKQTCAKIGETKVRPQQYQVCLVQLTVNKLLKNLSLSITKVLLNCFRFRNVSL